MIRAFIWVLAVIPFCLIFSAIVLAAAEKFLG
jgi:uncharacterized membrane protein